MRGMGMEAWGAGEKDILKNIDRQTEAMKDYIDLVKK